MATAQHTAGDRVSVIFVREQAAQVTGSGCCGKLEGEHGLVCRIDDLFSHTRAVQRDFGVLHRAVREFFPPSQGIEQVTVVSVDPRNQLYLAAKLWRDVFRFRPGFIESIRTISQWFAIPAVIVNGRVLSRPGHPVDPDSLCHEIHRCLGNPIGDELPPHPAGDERDRL